MQTAFRHKRHGIAAAVLAAVMLPVSGCGSVPESEAPTLPDITAEVTLPVTTEQTSVAASTSEQTTSAAQTESTAAVTETSTQTVTAVQSTKMTAAAFGETRVINGITVLDAGTDHARALDGFYGNYNVGTLFAQTVNRWKTAVGDDVRVWCMAAPTSQAFYKPAGMPEYNGSQLDQWNNIEQNLQGVTGVPLFDALAPHKDEEIYARTDYHWFARGAYYAASAFAELAGLPSAPLDSYEAVTRDGYLGAFYRVNKIAALEVAPEQFTYYKPDNLSQLQCTVYDTSYRNPAAGSLFKESLPIGSSYQIFGGKDDIILEVRTNAGTGRVLVIFKDSFGNALVPFLTHSFDKIVLCDYRYFNPDPVTFIRNEGATDLLICMATANIMSRTKTEQLGALLQ